MVGLVAAGAIGGGIVACARSDAPSGVALVNADTGPVGAKIVQSLQQDGGGFEWTAAQADSASTDDFAAVITLPADFSESMGTLAGAQPRRAKVTVATNDDADANLVNGAVQEVTQRIGATGVDAALAAMSQARTQMSSVQFTAQLLSAGVNAAAASAEQFSGGAEQLLGFLEFAKSGAAQLTSAISQLQSTADGAATQANALAAALDSTGVTIAQVEQTATTVATGLDQILPLLRGLPFAGDPAVADVIKKLEGLQTVSGQAGSQLDGLSALTGEPIDPNTDLGTVVRTVVDRLTSASAQLAQGAQLAEGIPQLAEQGGGQLVAALGQIDGGVAQLKAIVGSLSTQTDKALATLPPRSSSQQSAIAMALADPVDIVRE